MEEETLVVDDELSSEQVDEFAKKAHNQTVKMLEENRKKVRMEALAHEEAERRLKDTIKELEERFAGMSNQARDRKAAIDRLGKDIAERRKELEGKRNAVHKLQDGVRKQEVERQGKQVELDRLNKELEDREGRARNAINLSIKVGQTLLSHFLAMQNTLGLFPNQGARSEVGAKFGNGEIKKLVAAQQEGIKAIHKAYCGSQD